jgi:hypothetical protein
MWPRSGQWRADSAAASSASPSAPTAA